MCGGVGGSLGESRVGERAHDVPSATRSWHGKVGLLQSRFVMRWGGAKASQQRRPARLTTCVTPHSSATLVPEHDQMTATLSQPACFDRACVPPSPLRWAGGKHRFATRIAGFLRDRAVGRLYVEPFVGAASVFFALQPERSLLSDSNEHLISFYQHLRDSPSLVHRHFELMLRQDQASFYYSVRDEFNRSRWSARQAARFLYLNRTCFNGVYRVNTDGKYNVPYGHKPKPAARSLDELTTLSLALRNSILTHDCFRDTLPSIPEHSIVFLDPPYPEEDSTAYFHHYTAERFTEEDHHDLVDAVHDLHARRIPFALTIRSTAHTRKAYAAFDMIRFPVTHHVSCKSAKRQAEELLVWNLE